MFFVCFCLCVCVCVTNCKAFNEAYLSFCFREIWLRSLFKTVLFFMLERISLVFTSSLFFQGDLNVFGECLGRFLESSVVFWLDVL